jgi:hypothetical protein
MPVAIRVAGFPLSGSRALTEKSMFDIRVRKLAKWTVASIFLLVWVSWMIVIHRHWNALRDGAQPSAVILLMLFPLPYTEVLRGREGSLYVAFLTYMLLFFAIRVVCR